MNANFLPMMLASVLCVLAPAQAIEPEIGLTMRGTLDTANNTTVRVGTMRVWENRAAREGKIISLDVVVLPATGDKRVPDPVFVFTGGARPECGDHGQCLA